MPGQPLSPKFKAKLLAEAREVAPHAQAYARSLADRKRPTVIRDAEARAAEHALLTTEQRAARNEADALLHAAVGRMRAHVAVPVATVPADVPAAPVQPVLPASDAQAIMQGNKFFTRGTE
jgi:hypothetical protein